MTGGGLSRVGRELAGYRIEAALGQGAMGVVYQAVDVHLGRKVALKVLAGELGDDERFQRRFVRESRMIASLEHPHIVPVYSAGEVDGLLYIAMRFVDGGDLGSLIGTGGPLDLARTTVMISQVAAALDAAHEEGLVHRDVKPANILVERRRNGAVHHYLSDFGIAKTQTSGHSLTGTGNIIGTTDYIAPEQIEAKPLDGRADLYALGCVLYQCLTGVPPFQRGEQYATLWAHLQDPPPSVTAERPDLPPAVDAVVATALAKRPRDRFRTCGELAEALAGVAGAGVPAGRGGFPRSAETTISPGPPPGPAPGATVPPDGATATVGITPPVPETTPGSVSPGRTARWFRRPSAVAATVGVLVVGLMAALLVGGDRFPDEREVELLAQLPTELRESCERASADGAATAVRCRPEDGADEVVFTGFVSAAGLDTAYRRHVDDAGVAPDSGDCASGGGAEQAFPDGRLLCHGTDSSSVLVWTAAEQRILAVANRSDGDDRALYTWWAGLVGVPVAEPFPAADEQALLAGLPETDCARAGDTGALAGAVAGVECTPRGEGATSVRYYRFLDAAGMQRAYGQSVQAVQPPVGPRCEENAPPDFLAENEWSSRDQPSGRLLCYRRPAGPAVMEWTHDALLVLGRAEGPDPAALAQWWRVSSGPLRPVVDGESFPNAAEQALLDELPADVRANCRRPPPADVAGRVSGVECGPLGDVETVQFYKYVDLAAVRQVLRLVQSQFPSSASCAENPPGFVGGSRYTIDGEEAGGLLCFPIPEDGRPSILWTDEAALIQAQAVGTDLPPLTAWWSTYGGVNRDATP
jgi:hypothetical protein